MRNEGKILRVLRKSRNWSQKELADKLNVSEACVGLWEQGRRKIDYDSLITIADLFDVSCDFLLGRVFAKTDEKPIEIDAFSYALFQEVADLTDNQRNDILDMVKIFKRTLLMRGEKENEKN